MSARTALSAIRYKGHECGFFFRRPFSFFFEPEVGKGSEIFDCAGILPFVYNLIPDTHAADAGIELYVCLNNNAGFIVLLNNLKMPAGFCFRNGMGNIFHAASRHGSDEHIALLFKGAVDARELKLCKLIRFLEESGPGLEVLIQSGIVRGVCKVNETDPIFMNSKRHIQL